MSTVYYIGGSPCSGKSTIAEILEKKYDMHYFKPDDFLDRYTDLGALLNREVCVKQKIMSPDDNWMREPNEQCREELLFYHEIFDFIRRDLSDVETDKDIITEGAAYIPELMKAAGIPNNRYLSVTPVRQFQIEKYSKRDWIHFILDECSNGKKAFENWMERDCLFADAVRAQCAETDYLSIVNDGSRSVEQILLLIERQFELL